MRSLCVILFAILLTGHTYGQTPPTLVTLDAGGTLYTAIITLLSTVEKCYIETPTGKIVQFKPTDESNERFQGLPPAEFIGCRANVTNVDVSDSGLWTLHAELAGGIKSSQSYRLTVNPPPETTVSTTVTPEIIETTVTEIDQVTTQAPDIRYLEEKHFNSKIGDVETILIEDNTFVNSDGCRVITPSGEQYNLQKLNLANVKATEHPYGLCGITIHIKSEDVVGNWTLISEGSHYSERIERRLRFSINVEEIVDASVSKVTVVEGTDFYIRLRDAIDNYDTCRLLRPNGNLYDAEIDNRYVEKCGFVVRNVNFEDSGKWAILYGNRIIHRAPVSVTVNATSSNEVTNLVWTRDQPVDVTLGAENALYCKITSPEGHAYYNDFGRCEVSIERVVLEHEGIWKISVGLPGRVRTQDSEIRVRVVESEPKPVVTTNVETNKPTVSLTCSVSSPYPIRSCKFRHPSGRILLANEGVGEDRFTYHGAEVSYQSDLHDHDCGLLITNPLEEDLGLWRCAMETDSEVYYGFLSVLCPWAMRDPEVAAAVVSEPTLTANRRAVTGMLGDAVTMSCSVQSAIRYCYFRARNGTVFNVGPGTAHDLASYVGAGLDAGECGIRFPSLSVSDSGAWSCHVGLSDSSLPEQRANIDVNIFDPMTAVQRMEGSNLYVEAQMYDNRVLEYCRFVRIDGLGFTTENLPENYIYVSNLEIGQCGIGINNPSILEHHPWTVVAKIRGTDNEIARETTMTIQVPEGPGNVVIYYRLPVGWVILLSLGLSMILLSLLFGPVKNRRWTYERATAIRNSFMKKAVAQNIQNNNNNNTNTAMAA